jgi:hypothetical protein
MTLEISLLALESVLLVATIVLLVMSIREGRSRNALILEVGRATRVLTRQEYFVTVIDSMMDARQEVVGCITGRVPSGEDRKRTQEVVYNIERLAREGVKVKYVMPRFQDRLYLGWLYSRAGAEVRFSRCALVHDLRYMVVDGRDALIGVPEAVGEAEATKKGYRIPSEGLSSILLTHFFSCWEENLDFEAYALDTMRQTGASAETLSRELGIEAGDLLKIAARK